MSGRAAGSAAQHAATGRERLAAAQEAMARDGLAALLLVNSANLLFLSGYPALELTLARPFYLVVPLAGDPVLLVHAGREAEARRYAWVTDVRTYARLSVAPLDELGAIVVALGLRRGRIGAELGFEQRVGLPIAEFERVRAALAPAVVEDAATLLWRLRMRKSARDVAALREAGRITAAAYAETFAATRAGDPDRLPVRRMQLAMAQGGGGGAWVLVTAGRGNYALATGVATGRPLTRGDMLWMDAGCAVRGFWSDFSRAAVIGGPSREQVAAQRAIVELTAAGVTMARPGVAVADIAAAMAAGVHRLGLPVTSWTSDLAGRVGHGIGYDVTEPPHVSTSDPTILEPGMVISVEPGVATEFGLFHCEENVLVTGAEAEILSVSPRELATVPIR